MPGRRVTERQDCFSVFSPRYRPRKNLLSLHPPKSHPIIERVGTLANHVAPYAHLTVAVLDRPGLQGCDEGRARPPAPPRLVDDQRANLGEGIGVHAMSPEDV